MVRKINIQRYKIPDGHPEEPYLTAQGYKMADPKVGEDRHHKRHAIYVETLEEVTKYLTNGYSLWMRQSGKRETLISASSLKVSES